MTNKMATQCKIILKYLEDNKIVGEENAIGGNDFCTILKNKYPTYFDEDFNKVALQRRIMFLKRGDIPNVDMVRIIGSSPNGYFLAKRGDNSLDFQKKLAVTHLETAIKAGVSKEYFYQVLNYLDNKNVVDNQCVLPITPNTHKVAHIYSDDLLEE